MNVYKVELMIIDHGNIGESELLDIIEETRYPNRCISPKVMDIQSRDIGQWHDGHPLNIRSKQRDEYRELFKSID